MDKNTPESTNRLLKVIVALLLRGRSEETPKLRQQIKFLHDLRLKPIEIAEILGRTNNHINKELSGIRKSRKQKE
jgi:prolipoprotein diacylglyceryltransferase